MDKNAELLLKASQARQWEDEERSSYDLETMKAEFQQRLYKHECASSEPPKDGPHAESK